MIELHTFAGRDGLESLSPFCMKVEAYLKLTRTPYRAVTGNIFKAPKGKLPFIVDQGEIVADSAAILERFEARREERLDAGMSSTDAALARVIVRTFEEGLYFVLLWNRWLDDRCWAVVAPTFFGMLPPPLRWTVPGLVRRKVRAALVGQGTGRHSRDEAYAMGAADLTALATLLGDKPFFLGDELRSVDLTAYAFLANILQFDVDTPFRAAAQAHPNLAAFVARVRGRVERGG